MTPSVCLSVNFFNDAQALRGLLETMSRWVDNIYCINAGPGGAYSTDGSIELAESFGATVKYGDIDEGFGRIRTRLIHECGCTFAMILDCDERIYPQINTMLCEGNEAYPAQPTPNLTVTVKPEVINQLDRIRSAIRDPNTLSIRATRRHWFDYSFKRPSQNWFHIPDHQLRIVKNIPELGYERDRRMHERLIDIRTGTTPVYVAQDEQQLGGVFFDHFHLFYRRTQPGKKEANEQNYSRLERGEKMIV